jgi:5-methyltetrahydrofolate--homocysteine methyltransferase
VRREAQRHRTSEVARHLRRQETSAEDVLWRALRGRRLAGLKFRRQHPAGKLVLDFACPDHRLAIEVDGSVHDDLIERDAARTRLLNEMGYRVIRFRNDEVLNRLPDVLRRILNAVRSEQLSS